MILQNEKNNSGNNHNKINNNNHNNSNKNNHNNNSNSSRKYTYENMMETMKKFALVLRVHRWYSIQAFHVTPKNKGQTESLL